MTKDELIVKQQLEIEQLREAIVKYESAKDAVYGIIFCIGGPLNDNKLGYTKEQKTDFWRIKEAMDL